MRRAGTAPGASPGASGGLSRGGQKGGKRADRLGRCWELRGLFRGCVGAACGRWPSGGCYHNPPPPWLRSNDVKGWDPVGSGSPTQREALVHYVRTHRTFKAEVAFGSRKRLSLSHPVLTAHGFRHLRLPRGHTSMATYPHCAVEAQWDRRSHLRLCPAQLGNCCATRNCHGMLGGQP